MDFNTLITAMVNGIFVGAGASLGTWFVNRHFIRHLEQLEQQLKENEVKKE